LTGFYNRDEKCLLRGTEWVFKYDSASISSFSPRKPGFYPRQVRVTFLVEKLAFRYVYLPVLLFSYANIITLVLQGIRDHFPGDPWIRFYSVIKNYLCT